MLRVIRPEAGEEPAGFFDLIEGHQVRKPAFAGFLIVEDFNLSDFESRLKPPFSLPGF